MSDYNWCHGPECHTKHTQDRVRGVKGSKVLRTRKIKLNQWNSSGQWGFFCSNHCQNDFWKTYATQIVAIAPRTEALETPINITKEVHESTYWGRQTRTKIEVDETRSTDIG
jgi:cytoskeletal protein RodZ